MECASSCLTGAVETPLEDGNITAVISLARVRAGFADLIVAGVFEEAA